MRGTVYLGVAANASSTRSTTSAVTATSVATKANERDEATNILPRTTPNPNPDSSSGDDDGEKGADTVTIVVVVVIIVCVLVGGSAGLIYCRSTKGPADAPRQGAHVPHFDAPANINNAVFDNSNTPYVHADCAVGMCMRIGR